MTTRREFLTRSSLLAGAALAGGCSTCSLFGPDGAPMQGFVAPKLSRIRVGVVGMGGRGTGFVLRALHLPGVEVVAVCDNVEPKIKRANKILTDAKRPAAKEYFGDTAWRRLCEDPSVDVVYNTTPWALHVPVQLGALNGGKHVFTEVPSAFTVDECWELVETSERTGRICMQLENCLYGEVELLSLNLARLGMLGEIVHGEGAYIHDLRHDLAEYEGEQPEAWRFDHNRDHRGNLYPTHGLVPICAAMGVNRGDRLDFLVSVDSKQANLKKYCDEHLKPENPRRQCEIATGDMNSSLIRTVKGKTILLQHDVSSPRPYSRIQLLTGTKGAICDYPLRLGFESKPGGGVHSWFGERETREVSAKYMHPLWKAVGELAQRVGGHGGMDFIMDARWTYCLKQGLPTDMDVYDLAATCCICELTEKSVKRGSRPYAIPDFTRGAWRTAPELGIVTIDPIKMGWTEAKKA